MHQFEIDLSSHDASRFDAVFWSFLKAHFAESDAPDVGLKSYRLGDVQRRTVSFDSTEMTRRFIDYWATLRPTTAVQTI